MLNIKEDLATKRLRTKELLMEKIEEVINIALCEMLEHADWLGKPGDVDCDEQGADLVQWLRSHGVNARYNSAEQTINLGRD